MNFENGATLFGELLVFFGTVHSRLLVIVQICGGRLQEANHILCQRLTVVTVELLFQIIGIFSDVCNFLRDAEHFIINLLSK